MNTLQVRVPSAVIHSFYPSSASRAPSPWPRPLLLLSALYRHRTLPSFPSVSYCPFSVLHRPPPSYPGHVPLTTIERAALAVGSSIAALRDPHRHDMIAALGEATATPIFLPRLRDTMLAHPTGRRILRDRPRITSHTPALAADRLASLPPSSLGRAYADWLAREGVSPDTRAAVRYVDDPECAYVMQRYRECHDFYHALTGLPVVREGELALKAFELAAIGLPMTGLSLVAVGTLRSDERARFFSIYLPWALKNGHAARHSLINVYWEEQLHRDLGQLRAELAIEPPPDMRRIRKMRRAQQQQQQQKQKQEQEQK